MMLIQRICMALRGLGRRIRVESAISDKAAMLLMYRITSCRSEADNSLNKTATGDHASFVTSVNEINKHPPSKQKKKGSKSD